MSMVYGQIAESYRKWDQDALESAAGVIDFLGKIE